MPRPSEYNFVSLLNELLKCKNTAQCADKLRQNGLSWALAKQRYTKSQYEQLRAPYEKLLAEEAIARGSLPVNQFREAQRKRRHELYLAYKAGNFKSIDAACKPLGTTHNTLTKAIRENEHGEEATIPRADQHPGTGENQ